MLAAEKPEGIRAAINFAGAAMSWKGNDLKRSRLLASATRAKVPVLFVQAENDFNTAPSRELCEAMLPSGKQCRVRIYPPFGTTAMDGHSFAYDGSDIWSHEVFRFLDEVRGRKPFRSE
jgi:carboxymethylenebutenolidase